MLKVTQWVSNTAAGGVKSQNLVPYLLEDNDLYINWFFALLSACVTGKTPWEFITVKKTKSGTTQHFVIQPPNTCLPYLPLWCLHGQLRKPGVKHLYTEQSLMKELTLDQDRGGGGGERERCDTEHLTTEFSTPL